MSFPAWRRGLLPINLRGYFIMLTKPVRNPIKTSRKKSGGIKPRKGSKGGIVPSIKMNRAIRCESSLESNLAQILEVNPDVMEFMEQPMRVKYQLDEIFHTYTPDFGVIFRNGRKVAYEVKPSEKAMKHGNVRKLRVVKIVLASMGWDLEVITERIISRQPRLLNAELIFRYSNPPLNLTDRDRVMAAVSEAAPITLEEAARNLGGDNSTNLLCTAIRAGIIGMDMSTPFSNDSRVWIAGKRLRVVR